MNNLIECFSPNLLVMDLDIEAMEQFKNYRLTMPQTRRGDKFHPEMSS
jgi:hypothetical protein